MSGPSRELLFGVGDYRVSIQEPPHYDVTRDDQRFVMLQIGDADSDAGLILVENFLEELRERVPN